MSRPLRPTTGPVVLVVTEVDDPTADLVITELNQRGRVNVVRLDPAEFPSSVMFAAALDVASNARGPDGQSSWQGTLTTATREVGLECVRSVYWRRPNAYRFPGLAPQHREFAAAQARGGFGGVLASLDACYVNHPLSNWTAEFKPAQLVTAAALGFSVPATLITSDPAVAHAFAVKHAPVVHKPLRVTDLQNDAGRPVAMWTQRVSASDLDESVAGTAHLFQAEVPKVGDLRVTVVGDRVFAVRIDAPPDVLDWRTSYECLTYTPVDVPAVLRPRLLAYLDRFRLTFGCFDFALAADGTPWFLECNPNGQWAWLEPPTGLPMTSAFADALEGLL